MSYTLHEAVPCMGRVQPVGHVQRGKLQIWPAKLEKIIFIVRKSKMLYFIKFFNILRAIKAHIFYISHNVFPPMKWATQSTPSICVPPVTEFAHLCAIQHAVRAYI